MAITYKSGRRIQATSTDFAGIPAVSGGWVELARTTLGSAGDTIEVGSIPDKRYYMVLWDGINTGNLDDPHLRLGSGSIDTGSNYSSRGDYNGGEQSLSAQSSILLGKNNGSVRRWGCLYIANKSDKEKLIISNAMQFNDTYPIPARSVGKWADTSNPLDTLRITNVGTGDFASGSEVVVLGWDTTDTHTSNFWEELASVNLSGGAANLIDSGTFAAKKYLWIQLYVGTTGGAVSQRLTFNSDTGANYAQWRVPDGGTVSNGSGLVNIDGFNDDMVTNSGGFTEFFIINNSSGEKTGFVNSVSQEATGSGASPTRDVGGLKWTNTSSQITKLTFTNNKAGSMDTNTILKVWGHD
tara:strand:- start:504 stop:1565 length:1062 start_codon:yes stop_codon:yes gene_type:complete